MSRIQLETPQKAQQAVDALYQVLEGRLAANPAGLCPVDTCLSFLRLCHSQSCGKCVPCRIGLGQLAQLLEDVLEGQASMATLSLIEKTAQSIYLTADCAIGYEAARMVHKSVSDFRDDFIAHITENRCLGNLEQSIPCVSFCPSHVDIPGYIALVADGRYDDAVQLIRKDNPFPTACAFVCEHPCETNCRRNMVDDAINIRALKRYAVDHGGHVPAPAAAPATGKQVAVIGGGPSGMTAAYYLQLMGHQVTVYERLGYLGGMLRYGIPSYRLPRQRLDDDLNHILATGVQVKFGVNVGTDVTLENLLEQYDAVYLSIGAHTDKKLKIEGENADGVMSAVEMLRRIGENNPPDFKGKRIMVVGGGNVAMDVARSSIRLGAEKVTIAYRRRKKDMTALAEEVEGAVAEGCEVLEMYAPDHIQTNDAGHCIAMGLRPQIAGAIDRSGRPTPMDAPEPILEIPCDIVVVAIGQNIQWEYFAEKGIPVNRGTITADNDSAVSTVEGLFAGGDCVTGPATVIRSIAAGKVAAVNIDAYLGYQHKLDFGVTVPEPHFIDRTPWGRCNTKEREACDRKQDFEMIEYSLSQTEAKQEALRCLRCDKHGLGALKGGRVEQW